MRKGHIYGVVISLLFFFPLSVKAFFGPYGKLWLQSRGEGRVTVEMLEERWQDYDVYFAGPWIGRPSAILFDPKYDQKKIILHKWWAPVKTQEELEEVFWGIRVGQVSFFPNVWMILGPKGELYGYMYTAWHHVLIKGVDEKTIWVDDLPLPRLDPVDFDRGMVD